jgi:hypothetical protein
MSGNKAFRASNVGGATRIHDDDLPDTEHTQDSSTSWAVGRSRADGIELMELGVYSFGDVKTDPQTGKRMSTGQAIRDLMETIVLADEAGLDYKVTAAHKAEPVTKWVADPKDSRWARSFIPTSSSWMNQVEIFFSVIQKKVVTPNDFASLSELSATLLGFVAATTRPPGRSAGNSPPATCTTSWIASANTTSKTHRANRCRRPHDKPPTNLRGHPLKLGRRGARPPPWAGSRLT